MSFLHSFVSSHNLLSHKLLFHTIPNCTYFSQNPVYITSIILGLFFLTIFTYDLSLCSLVQICLVMLFCATSQHFSNEYTNCSTSVSPSNIYPMAIAFKKVLLIYDRNIQCMFTPHVLHIWIRRSRSCPIHLYCYLPLSYADRPEYLPDCIATVSLPPVASILKSSALFRLLNLTGSLVTKKNVEHKLNS